jgi:hypothetical protein
MNSALAAIEAEISKQAREAAIKDVGKVFSNLILDLYHLGAKAHDLDLIPLQSKVVDLVTKEKACLLAERILRANSIAKQEAEMQKRLSDEREAQE